MSRILFRHNEMKNILLGYVCLLMIVSCVGQQKKSEIMSGEPEEQVPEADSLNIQDGDLSDTLIVVDEVIPVTADASFIDFLYYFTSDEDFQRSRVLFPVSFYNDTTVERLNADEWVFDPMFDSDKIYTVIFDKEDELELENDTPSGSVQIDWIYLSDYHIRRYYFELKNNQWFLEAVNKEKMSRESSGAEDFYDFYVRFASDSVFQAERLANPLLFSTVDPEDEFSVLETTLEEGQWFAFRPPMPVAKISNIRYGQQETVKSNTKIVEFKGLGNGFSNTLYFRRIHGKWKLVKFEDLGD